MPIRPPIDHRSVVFSRFAAIQLWNHRTKLRALLALLVSVVCCVGAAMAEVLLVTYKDAGGMASWYQDSNPIPASYTASRTDVAIWGETGTLGFGPIVSYFTSDHFGGVDLVDGPQFFTGTTAAPVFSVGTFNGLGRGRYESGVITFAAAVPESSTWAMMILGFGLVAGVIWRRRSQVALQF